MKVLAIADRAPLKPISEILAEESVDLIVTLGDLDLAEIRALENVKTIPKLGVYGNHCSGQYMDQLGIRNMHLGVFEFGGRVFGGFEGSVRYKPSPYAKMYTQEEAEALLRDFPRVDVMLTHCPPFGINDDQDDISHVGFQAMRAYLERHKPTYWFHGHTYPQPHQLITNYQQTRIVYVHGHSIVTI